MAHEFLRAKVTLSNEKGQSFKSELGEGVAQPREDEPPRNPSPCNGDIAKAIYPVKIRPNDTANKFPVLDFPNRGTIAGGSKTAPLLCNPAIDFFRWFENNQKSLPAMKRMSAPRKETVTEFDTI
jgi:hypothetical protein